MVINDFTKDIRSLKKEKIDADFVITGGGISGVCAAITAARQGLRTVLVQDRPVLGGNGSSEIRLWMLGATSHMGNNNRWAREGGVIDEILVENLWRNPEGNPVIFDTVMLDKTVSEPNIRLLLNTSVYEIKKSSATRIQSITGFCSQNSTIYELSAPLFCDASGDGIIGFLAGSPYRTGAESRDEFGELFAPADGYGELLGHSLYFYTRDTGHPVKYVAPSYAMDVTRYVPRFRNFNTKDQGCRLWWIEFGGDMDTVHDTEEIKWTLWKVIYGAWDYIKNSGKYPEAENLTLEWVGTLPGKRESRRFEGDYILRQQDIIEQRFHSDAVSYGGWSIDLHPAIGVFGEEPPCNQWHSKGIYQIPYRCMYSRSIDNLFLAGRIISVSHVAFGSTRVMTTSAHSAQAVGMAASICHEKSIGPRELLEKGLVPHLQMLLNRAGQYIPGIDTADPDNIASSADLTATSELCLDGFPEDDGMKPLNESAGEMIPVSKGTSPGKISIRISASEATDVEAELRISSKPENYTPDVTLETVRRHLSAGEQILELDFNATIPHTQYAFILFRKNPKISLQYSKARVTGVLSVFNSVNEAVSNFGKQTPPEGIGIDSFEFWCPARRPGGQNLAIHAARPFHVFRADNVRTCTERPTAAPNAWIASWSDPEPALTLSWQRTVKIRKMILYFDTDFDHPMESVQMGHPERRMPFCVSEYSIYDNKGTLLYTKTGNYQTINTIIFDKPAETDAVTIRMQHPTPCTPAAIFCVRCYE